MARVKSLAPEKRREVLNEVKVQLTESIISCKWIDPNFKFRALDAEGHGYEHFCYANSKEELETRLKARNLTAEWIKDYDFTEWKIGAEEAKDKAIAAYK